MSSKTIVYAIDTSGMARVEFEDVHSYERHEWTDNAPDPRQDGTLVERFE